ncbi:hypothetical protein MRX96_014226 [Rhipicephalus microplus]
MPSCMQLLSAFETRSIATARDPLDSSVPAGKLAVLSARCDFRSPPHSSCEHASTTTGMQTPDLPSGEFSSSKRECVGSSTVIQPEPVAATSEQSPTAKQKRSATFGSERPPPFVERCAPGHLRPLASRHRTSKTHSHGTCAKSCEGFIHDPRKGFSASVTLAVARISRCHS